MQSIDESFELIVLFRRNRSVKKIIQILNVFCQVLISNENTLGQVCVKVAQLIGLNFTVAI